MLANILDIDVEAMRISLHHSQGAILLFDFEAAFPSVSHEYIWAVLRIVGVPQDVIISYLKVIYV